METTNNYMELRNEITATVTNHTNKLIDDLEMKYQQMNKRMEKRQEEALEMVFNRLDKTLDNINRQTNFRTEKEQLFNNRNIDNIANENIQIIIDNTIDNMKIGIEEPILSQQKKEKKPQQNLLYLFINN